MRCTNCDTEIPSGASFCPTCGERLPESDAMAGGTPGELERPFEPAEPAEPADERSAEPAAESPAPADPPPRQPSEAPARDRFVDAAQAKQQPAPAEAERSLWHGSFSGKAMVGHFVVGGLVVVALAVLYFKLWTFGKALMWTVATFLIIETILWAWLMVRKLSVNYELTTQRFIHKRGLLSRVTDRIELIDIDDVTFIQGPIERLLGVGTIKITSSDQTHPVLELPGIDSVAEVADKIDDLRRDERRRRSLHIEAI